MLVGDKIKAKWTQIFPDNVTKDKIYEIVEVTRNVGFWIINDKGEKSFPVSVSFTKVEEEKNWS